MQFDRIDRRRLIAIAAGAAGATAAATAGRAAPVQAAPALGPVVAVGGAILGA